MSKDGTYISFSDWAAFYWSLRYIPIEVPNVGWVAVERTVFLDLDTARHL